MLFDYLYDRIINLHFYLLFVYNLLRVRVVPVHVCTLLCTTYYTKVRTDVHTRVPGTLLLYNL